MGVKFRYDTRIDWYHKAPLGLSTKMKRWRLTDRNKNDLHYEGKQYHFEDIRFTNGFPTANYEVGKLFGNRPSLTCEGVILRLIYYVEINTFYRKTRDSQANVNL